VKRAARKFTGKAIPKSKVPPDLLDVLFRWTGDIKDGVSSSKRSRPTAITWTRNLMLQRSSGKKSPV
jgi:hypothetical protein